MLGLNLTTLYRLIDRGKLRVIPGGVDLASVQAMRASGEPQTPTADSSDDGPMD